MNHDIRGASINEADRDRLRSMIATVGEPETLELLGLSRHAAYRALAGLTVREATARVIRAALAEHDARLRKVQA